MKTRSHHQGGNGRPRPEVISSSLATPAVRTLVAEVYAFTDDESGEACIGTEVSEAIAVESQVNDDGRVRYGVLAAPASADRVLSTFGLDDDATTAYRVVAADWPAVEDAERLRDTIAELTETVKFWQQAEVIREQARRNRKQEQKAEQARRASSD